MHKHHKRAYSHWILFVLCTVVFLALQWTSSVRTDVGFMREHIAEQFRLRKQQLQREGEAFFAQPRQSQVFSMSQEAAWEKEGFVFFYYQGGVLKAWSAASVPHMEGEVSLVQHRNIVALANGYYTPFYRRHGDEVLVGFALVQRSYRIENDYLANRFHEAYGIHQHVPIVLHKTYYNVYDEGGVFAFGLDISEYKPQVETGLSLLLFGVFICWLLLANVLIFQFYRRRVRSIFWAKILFVITLLAFRMVQIALHVPDVLYQTQLFQPLLYAYTLFFPSLGDLCVTLVIFIQCSILFRKHSGQREGEDWQPLHAPAKWIFSLFAFSFCYLLLYFAVDLFHSLVWDSSLDVSLQGFISQMPYTFVLHIAVCLISFAWAGISWHIVLEHMRFPQGFYKPLLCQLPAAVVLVLQLSNEYPVGLSLLMGLFGFIVLSYFVLLAKQRKILWNDAMVFALPLLLSGISAGIILHAQKQKSDENANILFTQLSSAKDPVVEFLFRDIEHEIMEDEILKDMLLKNMPVDSLKQYVLSNYFHSYWDKYSIEVVPCYPEERLLVLTEDSLQSCHQFFDRRIKLFGEPTSSRHLFFLNETLKQTNYIAKFQFHFDIASFYLFVEFSEKTLFEDVGYPDLLMDKGTKDRYKQLAAYSYALYDYNGVLVRKAGSYPYRGHLDRSERQGKKIVAFRKGGYDHLLQCMPNGKVWLLSKELPTWQQQISTPSYIFLLHVLALLFLFLFGGYRSGYFMRGTLRDRVQYSALLLLIITMAVLADRSIAYINEFNQDKQAQSLKEKARAIAIELEPLFEETAPQHLPEGVMFSSFLFYTDINVFDIHGQIVATSRPEVYQEHLISNLMHPHAFRQMTSHAAAVFMQKESIGEQSYQAIYQPIRNRKGDAVAYLHLPSFAQQAQQDREVALLLTSYVNIYVLLFILAACMTLLLSTWITYPLKKLQRHMRQIQIGKENEKIKWKHKDEIGGLIHEYNSMIDKLENQAYILAKTEREGAWQEMAKQVAHEIKNPLTPMRLSIQQIQRIRREKPAEFDLRYDDFTASLIHQIDAISDIVSAFSDLAKMTRKTPDRIDLIPCIQSVALLYSDEEVHLTFHYQNLPHAFIMGNKTQIVQVFNNLIKNAIQARKGDKQPQITIDLKQREKKYEITVSDDGIGISKEDMKRIFTPNFTTKDFGSGIGLTLVKSIIENTGGTIECLSKEDEGTHFILRLPTA